MLSKHAPRYTEREPTEGPAHDKQSNYSHNCINIRYIIDSSANLFITTGTISNASVSTIHRKSQIYNESIEIIMVKLTVTHRPSPMLGGPFALVVMDAIAGVSVCVEEAVASTIG